MSVEEPLPIPPWALKFDMICMPFVEVKDKLLVATASKVESYGKHCWESYFWFHLLTFVEATFDGLKAIFILVGDKTPEKYFTPAMCVSRGMLEGLFNVLALLDDPERQFKAFRLDDYLNWQTVYKQRLERYSGRPEWAEFFVERKAMLEAEAIALALTPEEKANLGFKDRWPTPKALQATIKDPAKLEAFKYFQYWHYGELSAAAHSRTYGLMMQTGNKGQGVTEQAGKLASNIVASSVMFLGAMLSEIDAHGNFGNHARLRKGWEYLSVVGPAVKEAFTLRYDKLLTRT